MYTKLASPVSQIFLYSFLKLSNDAAEWLNKIFLCIVFLSILISEDNLLIKLFKFKKLESTVKNLSNQTAKLTQKNKELTTKLKDISKQAKKTTKNTKILGGSLKNMIKTFYIILQKNLFTKQDK